jgi:hypothetical protein
MLGSLTMFSLTTSADIDLHSVQTETLPYIGHNSCKGSSHDYYYTNNMFKVPCKVVPSALAVIQGAIANNPR